MIKNPLISIITPTYNHNQFIAQTINSVINQTFSNWEMVIIDDGSTDGTHDIVKSFNESRIKYFYQENQGVENLTATYNNALKRCSGEYIAILEGDDYWPEYKLAEQTKALSDPDVVLSYGISCMVNHKGKKIGHSRIPDDSGIANNDPPGRALRGLFYNRYSFIPNLTVMMRREVLERTGGFVYVENLYQDYPTWVRMSLEGRFSALPVCLGYYRKHIDSATFNRTSKDHIACKYTFIADFIQTHKEQLRELGLDFDPSEIKPHWEKLRQIYTPFLHYDRAFLMASLGLFKEARESFRKYLKDNPCLKHRLMEYLFAVSGLLQYDIANPARISKEKFNSLLNKKHPVETHI